MKVGVIGCGNMGSIVVKAMAKADPDLEFFTYTPSQIRAQQLAQEVNGQFCSKISELEGMDAYILGFKPQQIKEVSQEFQGLTQNKIIISMLAAINIENLQKYFGSQKVIRIMPNTPIAKNEGIVLATSTEFDGKEILLNSLDKAAKIVHCKNDEELDKLTTVFGCGPAYIYYFFQVFKDSLSQLAFDSDDTNELIQKLFIGSSKMVGERAELNELIDQVTSKGGVTIEAINSLKSSSISNDFSVAIDKALKRSNELSEQLNLFS